MTAPTKLPKITPAQYRTMRCAERGTLDYVHGAWAEGERPVRHNLRWDFILRLLEAGLIVRVPSEKFGRGRGELTDLGRQVLRARRESEARS